MQSSISSFYFICVCMVLKFCFGLFLRYLGYRKYKTNRLTYWKRFTHDNQYPVVFLVDWE
eukprot:UN26565